MKVQVVYLNKPETRFPPLYTYEVSEEVRVGQKVVDEFDRVAEVVELGSGWEGRTLEAWPVRGGQG